MSQPRPATRTALVTGGAKRIGAAIVRALADDGWAVGIHCRNSVTEAEALAAELEAAGARTAVVTGDLADVAALGRVVPAANAALGPVTLLVNNAAVYLKDELGGLDTERWQTQLDVNLRAPVFLTEAFAAQLPDGLEGNIVNMIDQRVLRPTPEMTSYMLSKAALWTATQTLAQALAPRIRVNGIAPGPTFPNVYEGDAGFAREVATLPRPRRGCWRRRAGGPLHRGDAVHDGAGAGAGFRSASGVESRRWRSELTVTR